MSLQVAASGTAAGSGLNNLPDFGYKIAAQIGRLTKRPFINAPNKFAAQGSLDAMVHASAALHGLAVAIMKIANDFH
jgi:fumarate hydratase, class II